MASVSAYTRQTRAYEPDDPALKKKRIKPFKLTELEHVPREQRELHRAMLQALPEVVLDRDFLGKVRSILHQYTQMDIDLWLHSVRTYSRSSLRSLIPGTSFLGIIGLAPLAEKVILEVDLRFVYRVVERLLGGSGVVVDIHRPLTEIEQGVFSYVLLKVMALFYEGVVSPDQLAIRLEDMRHDLRGAADIVRHEENWVCVSWKMNFDLDVGYIRILAPASLARRVLNQQNPADTAVVERRHAIIRRRMNRLVGVSAEARVEIGRIDLRPAEINALDPGDIVLLEHTSLRLEEGRPAGGATMMIGLGRRGLIHGLVHTEQSTEQLVFEVTKIEIQETPSMHDPRVHHGVPANPEEVIAEYEDPHPEDEANDGSTSADELIDEDFGLDDENAGDDEEYGGEYDNAGGEPGYGDEDQEEPPPDDNLAESEPILGDVPIAVIVELGRVELTADEVIRLRAGQVIELGRSPSDAVDLVVGGKLLAKGELVEIDGALGVRILQIARET